MALLRSLEHVTGVVHSKARQLQRSFRGGNKLYTRGSCRGDPWDVEAWNIGAMALDGLGSSLRKSICGLAGVSQSELLRRCQDSCALASGALGLGLSGMVNRGQGSGSSIELSHPKHQQLQSTQRLPRVGRDEGWITCRSTTLVPYLRFEPYTPAALASPRLPSLCRHHEHRQEYLQRRD